MLHQDKHNLAAPAALQALKTSVELFGNGSIDITPAYFALAEANIGINYTIRHTSYMFYMLYGDNGI